MNDLKKLLAENPDLAERAKYRVGLAEVASLMLQLRSATGLTQKQLAGRSGVSETLISELENAANEGVTLRTLVRLAAGAGAKIELKLALNAEEPGVFVACLHDQKNYRSDLSERKTVKVVRRADDGTAASVAA